MRAITRRIERVFQYGVFGLLCSLAGCTALQWETTKAVATVAVLLPIVAIVDMPPVGVTSCRTRTSWQRGVSTTTCVAY